MKKINYNFISKYPISYFPKQIRNGVKFKIKSDKYDWFDYDKLNKVILNYANKRKFTIKDISYKDLDDKLIAVVVFNNKNNIEINDIRETEEYKIIESELLSLAERRIVKYKKKSLEEWSTFYNTYFLQTEYKVENFVKEILQS